MLDRLIAQARAVAWGLRPDHGADYSQASMSRQSPAPNAVSVTAAKPVGQEPFHLWPSQAYQDCLGQAVGGDGTLMGNVLAGSGLFAAAAPIVKKPRGGGANGGGDSGKYTSPISAAARSIVTPKTPAPKWVRDLGQEATKLYDLNLSNPKGDRFKSWNGHRTGYLGANLGRIGSAASRTLGVGSMIGPVDDFIKAAEACYTKVGR